MPHEVDLGSLYRFRQHNAADGQGKNYVCRGFDSSGLMHYLSNGNLPHSTLELKNIGVKLFVIDTSKPLKLSKVQNILKTLKDTDIVVHGAKNDEKFIPRHSGQVVMFYKFGFIEGRGQNWGIKKIPPREAEARFFEMYNKAKLADSDLYVIRWHPELLNNKTDNSYLHDM
jgi:hypothetical protein